MDPELFGLAFLLWLGFAGTAVAGGILRVIWLQPRVGEFAANMIETVVLVAVLAGVIAIAVPRLSPGLERPVLWRLGIFWLLLTVGFELLVGHFVAGASWTVLLLNYDVSAGRLWLLVPLTMGLGPVVAGAVWRRRGRNTAEPTGHGLAPR